jgi:hypothetical protein
VLMHLLQREEAQLLLRHLLTDDQDDVGKLAHGVCARLTKPVLSKRTSCVWSGKGTEMSRGSKNKPPQIEQMTGGSARRSLEGEDFASSNAGPRAGTGRKVS